jgi:hypothetical protein
MFGVFLMIDLAFLDHRLFHQILSSFLRMAIGSSADSVGEVLIIRRHEDGGDKSNDGD